MCGMCPDVLGGCNEIECGALPPRDEQGNRRARFGRWFVWGETPCRHVLEGHAADCAIREGAFCDCDD